ncbi:hypothetical protein FRC11_011203, partial [Ceratobasidium sp. 423]
RFLCSSCFPRHPLGDPRDSLHPQWPVISYTPSPSPAPPPPPSHLRLSPVPCMPSPGTAGDLIIIGSNSSDKEPSSEEMPSVEEKEYSSVEEKQYSSIEEQDYFSAEDDNPNVVPSVGNTNAPEPPRSPASCSQHGSASVCTSKSAPPPTPWPPLRLYLSARPSPSPYPVFPH